MSSFSRKVVYLTCVASFLALTTRALAGLGEPRQVVFAAEANAFPLVQKGAATSLLVAPDDWPGVTRTVGDLQADIERVSGLRPVVFNSAPNEAEGVIIVGTVGRSAVVDRLVKDGKLDVSAIRGKWEAWLMAVVEQPLPGVKRALVIAGSDKRGTIYGAYDVSEQIGVSPWYWWADVPPAHHDALYVRAGTTVHDSPVVKYRGIFLNDEAPALTGWAKEKFGGLNSKFYTHVFELLLRVRANYLWPAMWSNAFNEDDPENPRLADEYGIVMGTSHHEPMLRSQQEWVRHGHGAWNYETNGDTLARFWSDGVRRNRAYESIVTMGMRGDGDMAMSPTANTALLERIVADQRAILAREVNPHVEQIPQLWALYKEVQEYYEKGMKVPDDVTMLWCDDNYGNIRRLPTAEERKRPGGAGIYYHIDYVGWPRSYKWLNVTPITKIWEQMHLAAEYGADRIWIVNVGDLKPMEFPIEFFIRYGWSPQSWPYERLPEYGRLWAEREFGPEHAAEIERLVAQYTKLNGAIKPEYVSPDVFSVVNYDEAARVQAAWHDIDVKAGQIADALPPTAKDAFFQLVLWPIRACAITNEMYITAGRNRLYAFQGRAETNATAEHVRELFRADAALTQQYNELADGRWRHFADQTHFGYTGWQQPPRNTMPAVAEVQATPYGEIGVSIEGSPPAWPEMIPGMKRPTVPPLDSLTREPRWIEVFNRGLGSVEYQVRSAVPWLTVAEAKGVLTGPESRRLTLKIDWDAAPVGTTETTVSFMDQRGTRARVWVPVVKYPPSVAPQPGEFVEADSTIAIEAGHYASAVGDAEVTWRKLDDFGRTAGAVAAFPVTAESRTLAANSPHLEYRVYTVSSGKGDIELTLAPTLAFTPGRGLRLAVSVDDEVPQLIDLRLPVGDGQEKWGATVREAVRKATTQHEIARPGSHTIKVWMIDPAVVLERVVLSFGSVRPSYLGPPESFRN